MSELRVSSPTSPPVLKATWPSVSATGTTSLVRPGTSAATMPAPLNAKSLGKPESSIVLIQSEIVKLPANVESRAGGLGVQLTNEPLLESIGLRARAHEPLPAIARLVLVELPPFQLPPRSRLNPLPPMSAHRPAESKG